MLDRETRMSSLDFDPISLVIGFFFALEVKMFAMKLLMFMGEERGSAQVYVYRPDEARQVGKEYLG